jgi:hypothetical protein
MSHPDKSAKANELPPAVAAWFERLDADGRAALAREAWWRNLRDEPAGWEPLGKPHRQHAPMHYVLGRSSHFYIERYVSRDRQRVCYAVYFGPYTSNGYDAITTGQGGAQATIFDQMCAICAGVATNKRAPTGTLTVRMAAPVSPVPGAFRAEAWLHEVSGRKIIVRAHLKRGDSDTVLASAEAVHVAPRPSGKGEPVPYPEVAHLEQKRSRL